jgi:hypothetical protein
MPPSNSQPVKSTALEAVLCNSTHFSGFADGGSPLVDGNRLWSNMISLMTISLRSTT